MNAQQLADLLGAAAAAPRMRDAACRGRTEMADVDVRSGREVTDASLEVCLSCRHMQQCAAWVDSLPADQKPRGVVGATLVDPDAYQTVRAVMAADLAARQPTPKRQRSLSRSRLRGVLLEAVDSAGPEGVTVAEAAAALYGPAPTGTQVELARQALNRAVNRGLLRRIGGGRGGLARYVRGAVASAAAPDGRVGCADTPESAVAS